MLASVPHMRSPKLLLVLALTFSACGGSAPVAPPPETPVRMVRKHVSTQQVFEAVAPSVVAIYNDDRADREAEIAAFEKSMGDEIRAPKKIIDVSLRKEPMPHGTGFFVEGGYVITAAHVVFRPDKLKLTTRSGQTVDGEVVRLDEVRDIAVLRPKTPFKDVPPIALGATEIKIGERVWALGHTGKGFWALSWGITEGIASGVIDMFGAKLLLHDAQTFPGFSGGPVVTVDDKGVPVVLGVNHALLWTGDVPIAISSAIWVADIKSAIAGEPAGVEAKIQAYAKEQKAKVWADLFITDSLSVFKDTNKQAVAHIIGNSKTISSEGGAAARVPIVAMIFGLPVGDTDIEFRVQDAEEKVYATATRTVSTAEKQRVSFVSSSLEFVPPKSGNYHVEARLAENELGHAHLKVESDDDDDEVVESTDPDGITDGNPDVDVVVAELGFDNPLRLMGIRSAWEERSYPRRVGAFAWFARGSRGWSGTNVLVNAYVLDEGGKIVGRSDGCYMNEIRPESPWTCMGSGGSASPPLAMKAGRYDIVFALNDRPVAFWPMEAVIRDDPAPGGSLDRWLKQVKRPKSHKPKTPPPPPPPPGKPGAAKPGAAPVKPPAPKKP